MKKAALLLLGLAAVAMVTWYIFDPETEARWIGYQSDNMDTQVLSQMHPSVSAESSAGISHETGVMEKADIQPALPASPKPRRAGSWFGRMNSKRRN
jgi:hypothetical protein